MAAARPGRVSGPVRNRERRRRWARHVLGLLVVAIVVVWGGLRLSGASGSIRTAVAGLNPWWLAAGALLELASITAYARYTRALLPQAGRPRTRTLLAVDVSTWGTGHVVPGGTAGTAAPRYRLLHRVGVAPADAALLAGLQGIVSAVVLHALLLVAAAVAWARGGGGVTATVTVVTAAVLAGELVVGVLGATWMRPVLVRGACAVARRLPRVDPAEVSDRIGELGTQLRRIARRDGALAAALGWAAANWLLDAAVLVLFVAAVGGRGNLPEIVLAFALANALAVLPITPGGIGVVEGVLVPAVVAAGVPAGPAVVAVLAWRLLSYWLPIPLAGLTTGWLVARRWGPDAAGRPAPEPAGADAGGTVVPGPPALTGEPAAGDPATTERDTPRRIEEAS